LPKSHLDFGNRFHFGKSKNHPPSGQDDIIKHSFPREDNFSNKLFRQMFLSKVKVNIYKISKGDNSTMKRGF